MDFVANESYACTVGDSRKLQVQSEFRGNDISLQEACNTLADMCIDWGPRFIEAKRQGVDLDCNAFAEETAWRWRGACSRHAGMPGPKVVPFNKTWTLKDKEYAPNNHRKRYKEPDTNIYWLEMADGMYAQQTQETGKGELAN